MANRELKEAQLSLQIQSHDVEAQRNVVRLREITIFLSDPERLFYWQKTKCDYLRLSDRSTKFFHNIVKRNARCNFIPMVIKADGEPSSSSE